MTKFWDKIIKSSYETAKNLEIDEEKIRELKKGEREITGSTMDNVLKTLNENKIKENIRKSEAWKWYQENDLKSLRLKFGYKTQRDLMRELNIDNSQICRAEAKKINKPNDLILKLYDFYTNDFNIKVNKELKEQTKEKDFEVTNFFKEFDLQDYMNKNNLNRTQLILKLGYKGVNGSQTNKLNEIINHKTNEGNKILMKKLYNYIINNNVLDEECNNSPKNTAIKNISFAVAHESTPETELYNENNYDTESLSKNNYIMEKEYQPVEGIGLRKEQIIKDLQEKVNKLERQIMLYEKLIEKL